ncbi:1-deoxy-D-xylulose-5-phosphate reductoisomerase [Tersicoccus sp. MR15.9]|uniref:1-deoxy-D-xylulose-5-phosphate reductoisomerase n=1 Tax=Tersicoccus mangrovi TaxID=3121635 RepID=UPI002FE5DC25
MPDSRDDARTPPGRTAAPDAGPGGGSHRRTVSLLGSTGSIGTQAVSVVRANPDRFRVTALAAGGHDVPALAAQVVAVGAEAVGIATGDPAALQDAIDDAARAAGRAGQHRPQIEHGPDAASRIAAVGADVVLNGVTGSIGLRPTLAALDAGSTLALANKESLIVGGSLVTRRAAPGQLVPVDSEHSAIAQSLRAGRRGEVRRLVVTASGGPFRGRTRDQLRDVTPAEALAHPNFAMGRVITTNSATLVNKGLEVIEAHLLFDVPMDAIDVVVHPQQYIHSMVEFVDGAVVAQIGRPTMAVPIALGLGWPDRVPDAETPIDWTKAADWRFEPLDDEAFPAVVLARRAGSAGSTYPAVYNAANEECVEAFHAGRIGFLAITEIIERVLSEHRADGQLSVDTVLEAERWARARTHQLLGLL